jgi:hypothetical protein
MCQAGSSHGFSFSHASGRPCPARCSNWPSSSARRMRRSIHSSGRIKVRARRTLGEDGSRSHLTLGVEQQHLFSVLPGRRA